MQWYPYILNNNLTGWKRIVWFQTCVEGGDNLGLKSRPYISYVTVGESLISLGHNQLICKTWQIVSHQQPAGPNWREWFTVPFNFTSIIATYLLLIYFISWTNLKKKKQKNKKKVFQFPNLHPSRDSEMIFILFCFILFAFSIFPRKESLVFSA